MNLVENWQQILKEAWSVRTAGLSALLGGLSQALPFIPAALIGLTPEQSTALSGLLGALAVVTALLVPAARVADQGLAKQ